MNERLLQFLWQFQYFNRQQLCTTLGENIVIENAGQWNHHQGPDFTAAAIRIGETTWIGNVELHVYASDWHKHHHAADGHYQHIILHVVWMEDERIKDRYGNLIPTLILYQRISLLLLERYQTMMNAPVHIACKSFLPALSALNWCAWKERLAAERLERKAIQLLQVLEQKKFHWEEVFWCRLAGNFGKSVNTVLFEQVADSLTITMLARHRHRVDQLEALLMGQANLLHGDPAPDAYRKNLQDEYFFLQKKYRLRRVQQQPAFLRMRPAGFPTVRLAQLAVLLHRHTHLFASVKEMQEIKDALALFQATAGDYWNTHYVFGEPASCQPKQVGIQMAENILINTVLPFLFAYGMYHQADAYKKRAMQWLYQLKAENNKIIRHWKSCRIDARSAIDSQALTELHHCYCTNKRCLDCAVGNKIMKNHVSC